jgi:hypothetical protein
LGGIGGARRRSFAGRYRFGGHGRGVKRDAGGGEEGILILSSLNNQMVTPLDDRHVETVIELRGRRYFEGYDPRIGQHDGDLTVREFLNRALHVHLPGLRECCARKQ